MKLHILAKVLLLIILGHIVLQYFPQTQVQLSRPFEQFDQGPGWADLPTGIIPGNPRDPEQKDCDIITKPGNYYTSNNNRVNFESNVLDARLFYQRNPAPPEQPNPNPTGSVITQPPVRPCFSVDANADQPDFWQYKNELPMNGGVIFDNVHGMDGFDTGYARFTELKEGTPLPDGVCVQPADDVRQGLGYPGQEFWAHR